MKKLLTMCVSAAFICVGCNQPTVEQASQEFNQLPEVVRQVVRSKAPNAEIADVEKKTRQGRVLYEIQFRDPQRYPAMEVAADGMIVKYEAGTVALGRSGPPLEVQQGSGSSKGPLSALPLGVQQAIEAHAPRAPAVDIRRTEKNGRVVYEVEYAGREPRPVLHVTADGTIVKLPGEPVKPAGETNSTGISQ